MSKHLETCDIQAIIQRCAWFKDLPIDAHEALADAAELRTLGNNSYLWQAGDQPSEIFCVVEGLVRLNIASSMGHEFTIIDMESGHWCNETALVNDDRRISNAQVKGEALLLALPNQAVIKVGEDYPQLYKAIFTDYTKRTTGLYELMEGMFFHPLKVRLAGRILYLIEHYDYGEEADGGTYFNVKLSQNDFARLSLGSRQRINKIFREWNEKGIVLMRSDRYFIPDMDALARETEQTDPD